LTPRDGDDLPPLIPQLVSLVLRDNLVFPFHPRRLLLVLRRRRRSQDEQRGDGRQRQQSTYGPPARAHPNPPTSPNPPHAWPGRRQRLQRTKGRYAGPVNSTR